MRIEMPEKRKKYDREFREGAVRIVEETGKPIAQVARDLGVVEGTLGNWVKQARESRDGSSSLSRDDYAELQRLRGEVAELRMERDVLIGHVEARAPGRRGGRLMMSYRSEVLLETGAGPACPARLRRCGEPGSAVVRASPQGAFDHVP